MAQRESIFLTHPKIAAEWHPTKNDLGPSEVTKGSGKKVWWLCEKGHEWEATVADRTSGYGCPYCSGRRVSDANNLAVLFPEIAKEWHPDKNDLGPSEVTKSSGKKVWWLCEKGHEWEAIVNNRTRGRGCSYCSGRRV